KAKQAWEYEGRKYIDTPGLNDMKSRKEAAREIETALKENTIYKIIFVITLEAGRAKSQDFKTVNTICEAITVPFNYGIIFNKIHDNVIKKMGKRETKSGGLVDYLSVLNKQPSSIIIIKEEKAIHNEDNLYLKEHSEGKESLVRFISEL